jgi:hypothetical protein
MHRGRKEVIIQIYECGKIYVLPPGKPIYEQGKVVTFDTLTEPEEQPILEEKEK